MRRRYRTEKRNSWVNLIVSDVPRPWTTRKIKVYNRRAVVSTGEVIYISRLSYNCIKELRQQWKIKFYNTTIFFVYILYLCGWRIYNKLGVCVMLKCLARVGRICNNVYVTIMFVYLLCFKYLNLNSKVIFHNTYFQHFHRSRVWVVSFRSVSHLVSAITKKMAKNVFFNSYSINLASNQSWFSSTSKYTVLIWFVLISS